MLFSSYVFLLAFLPAVLSGWWGLSRWKPLRLAFLTGSSWFFYAWWDWRYLPVLIGATSVDFLAGRWIAASASEPRRRLLLAASLTTNVGIPRHVLPLLRAGEEAPDRGPAQPVRRQAVLRSRSPRPDQRLGGCGGVLTAALLRLLRLFRHGRRARLVAGLPVPAELQLAVQGRQRLRLLATLAHEPLVLVPRLPVHPTRRIAAKREADGAQPRGHDVPRRSVARRRLDLRCLGARARPLPRQPRRPAPCRLDTVEHPGQP